MSKIPLIFGLFLILTGLSSCRPKDVLSQGKMTDVLYDIHLTEALVDNPFKPFPAQWTRGMNTIDFRDMAYQSVLKKHGISEKEFYTSVDYYSKHLRLYKMIYTEVDKRFNVFIKEINDGKYGISTATGSAGNINANMMEYRNWYESAFFKLDTTLVQNMYLPVDSVPSNAEYISRQWLHKKAVEKNPFSMIPKNIDFSKVKSAALDSVLKSDTVVKNQIVKAVNTSLDSKKAVEALETRKAHLGLRTSMSKDKLLELSKRNHKEINK